MLGKDLNGLGLKELLEIEQQLNEGLFSIKERKVGGSYFGLQLAIKLIVIVGRVVSASAYSEQFL